MVELMVELMVVVRLPAVEPGLQAPCAAFAHASCSSGRICFAGAARGPDEPGWRGRGGRPRTSEWNERNKFQCWCFTVFDMRPFVMQVGVAQLVSSALL